jgi:hypothetical protein
VVAVQPALPAAHAAANYLEQGGIAPLRADGTVYADEREMLDPQRSYRQPHVAVHFGAKLLQWAMFDFGQGIPRVLVVLNPTARKQRLHALDMRATVDRDEFFAFQHGDGRLKLIERLAAAYRAGELPDYMLEFVDSLRTRAKRPLPEPRTRSNCPHDLFSSSGAPQHRDADFGSFPATSLLTVATTNIEPLCFKEVLGRGANRRDLQGASCQLRRPTPPALLNQEVLPSLKKSQFAGI